MINVTKLHLQVLIFQVTIVKIRATLLTLMKLKTLKTLTEAALATLRNLTINAFQKTAKDLMNMAPMFLEVIQANY